MHKHGHVCDRAPRVQYMLNRKFLFNFFRQIYKSRFHCFVCVCYQFLWQKKLMTCELKLKHCKLYTTGDLTII